MFSMKWLHGCTRLHGCPPTRSLQFRREFARIVTLWAQLLSFFKFKWHEAHTDHWHDRWIWPGQGLGRASVLFFHQKSLPRKSGWSNWFPTDNVTVCFPGISGSGVSEWDCLGGNNKASFEPIAKPGLGWA